MRELVLVPLLVAAVSGCVAKNPDIGRACDTAMPCPADMLCLPDYTGMSVCMEACAPTDMTKCTDQSTCLETPLGDRACYVGGPVGEGGVCTSTLDCLRGGLCVIEEGAAQAFCYRACDVGRTVHCLPDERCEATFEGEGICIR